MTADSPVAILFDGYGNQVLVINQALAVVQASTTGIIYSIPVSISDTLLLSPNANRRGVFIYNSTTSAVLRVGFSTTPVTAALFSVELSSGGVFEVPFGYTGELRGIWSVTEADGYGLITELV